MKELSIEEKAQRYDEAIKKFDVILNLNTVKESGTIFAEDVRKIFPELEESEDEKIRNRLISYFKSQMEARRDDSQEVLCTYSKWIAWIEKQGESDETKAKMFLINKGYPIDANGTFPTYEEMYNIIKKGLEEQGEKSQGKSALEAIEEEKVDNQNCAKPADKVKPKFKVGDKIKLAKESTYPAREIIAIKNDAYYFDKLVHLPFCYQDEWELVEQKSTWSKEDEETALGIEQLCNCASLLNILI